MNPMSSGCEDNFQVTMNPVHDDCVSKFEETMHPMKKECGDDFHVTMNPMQAASNSRISMARVGIRPKCPTRWI